MAWARKTGYTNSRGGRRGEHHRIKSKPIYREMLHKVLCINRAKPRNYPSKCRSADSSTSSGQTVMYIMSVTLSDLESSDEEFDEF